MKLLDAMRMSQSCQLVIQSRFWDLIQSLGRNIICDGVAVQSKFRCRRNIYLNTKLIIRICKKVNVNWYYHFDGWNHGEILNTNRPAVSLQQNLISFHCNFLTLFSYIILITYSYNFFLILFVRYNVSIVSFGRSDLKGLMCVL